MENFRKLMRYLLKIFCLTLLASNLVVAQTTIQTSVLVIGGGTSGTAAGIQSARLGVSTIIAEPTNWLGGMISSAGVSAFDGNHLLPSGIWAEFREKLYHVYGGPNKVSTGWVSNTLFEPHVADSILKSMVVKESKKLSVLFGYQFIKTVVQKNTIKGAVFYNKKTKKNITILAQQTIDATELGDAMASAGIPYHIGMEANTMTGEDVNVPASNNIIQDLTYVAILKDYGEKADCTIAKPIGYNPMEFDGCCKDFCSNPSKLTSNVDAKKMLDYGKLPNGKYMINWPGKGNDIYLNIIEKTETNRNTELLKAKAKTLRFLYFIQTQLGFKNLGLAKDEFPSNDYLPLIPYHRESRRLDGLVRLKIQDIATPFDAERTLYRTGISVGDYPIDHHHRENEDAPKNIGFYPIPSYNIPLGCLIPNKYQGIIIAEKSISVSNVVNGTTRLQPVVMLTGQASGALAALCVLHKKNAQQVSIRDVQNSLIQNNAYIMPYADVTPKHPHFAAIQRIGATGILKGVGQPNAWANRTWFYPDSVVTSKEFITGFKPFGSVVSSSDSLLTIERVITTIIQSNSRFVNPTYSKNIEGFTQQIIKEWKDNWGLKNFDTSRPITRLELAVLLNNTINPFNTKKVNHQGNFIQ
jgi:hypothetical protein